jgi:hydroxypyruvate isomerase
MKKIHFLIICFLLFFAGKMLSQNALQTSVVEWGFRCPFDYLCDVARQNGISTLELVEPEKWERAKQNGMQVLVATGADLGIERGFCNPDFHKQLQAEYLQLIPKAAENGIKMIICYSGIRPDLSSEQAMENCVAGLKPVIECAEKYNILVVMELISSRQSKALWWQFTFPYYACDNAAWGAALADKMQSPNFKLLYDVWQMNDMEANILNDIQKYNNYIALYHISGKNRKAITDDDTIDYPAILKAIRSTGYNGYIGLEFLIEKEIPESIRFSKSRIISTLTD